jgi:hypothetical protein
MSMSNEVDLCFSGLPHVEKVEKKMSPALPRQLSCEKRQS